MIKQYGFIASVVIFPVRLIPLLKITRGNASNTSIRPIVSTIAGTRIFQISDIR
jgi:hypothetical protein